MRETNKVSVPQFADRDFNILAYGAKSGGIYKNTAEINNAIDDCFKSGGGRVIIPHGLWLTGPITLKSNVNLFTESGAVVIFSSDFADYPLVKSNFEGIHDLRCMSPLNAQNAQNIAVTGYGVFDGNGDAWRPVKKMKMTENQWNALLKKGGYIEEGKETQIWWPSEEAYAVSQKIKDVYRGELNAEDFESGKEFFRPMLLSFVNCKNVLLEETTFQNSPSWCVHPRLCTNLTIRNIKVRNPWYSQNGDGLDLESCKNVVVERSTFDVGDDAICMKSGKDEDGRKLGVPTENVEIKDCIVYHGHGGFVIGSEMSGGVKNVKISNCSFIGTDVGLRFKSCRGRGGVVENISMDDIYMKEIKNEAITFTTYYASNGTPDENVEVSEKTPIFRNMVMNEVYCNGCGRSIDIVGLPEMPISDITLNNVYLKTETEANIENAKNIEFNNVTIEMKNGTKHYEKKIINA